MEESAEEFVNKIIGIYGEPVTRGDALATIHDLVILRDNESRAIAFRDAVRALERAE